MGELSEKKRDKLPKDEFAFPKERKEPITDAAHVRNAVARFDQVEGVSDAERDRAWKRIRAAAKKFDVEIEACAQRFDTVELNSTFYRMPKPETFDGWARQAPPGFVFAAKLGAFGSHR